MMLIRAAHVLGPPVAHATVRDIAACGDVFLD